MAEKYKFFCILMGEYSPFPVEIESNKTIGELKVEIKRAKQPQFDSFAADALSLFKINLPDDPDDPDDERLEERVNQRLKTEPALKLHARSNLSRYFAAPPPERGIHILIQTPSTVTSQFGQAPQRGLPQAISPSSVTTQTFQTKYGEDFDYGRPPHSGSIPLALLHQVFGEFIEDVQSCTPTARDNQHMLKLCEKMIQIHEYEAARALSFREIWEEFIPYPLEAGIIGGSSFATDGHIRRNRYFLVITEAKRELEGMKPDPLVQAAMYYLQALQPFKNSNGLFPCLLIYYAGSYIGFAGAVWNEKIQIEVLTPFYPLQGNPHQRNIRLQVARALAATRRAVTSLETHYNNLVIPPSVEENIIKPVSFPYRTYYESQGEVSQRQRIKFTYQKRIFNNRLMFIAKNTAGRLLFVKFTQRYSASAHKHCAEQGIAPTLYAAEKLPGDWIMVVMDYLDDNHYGELPGVYRDTETRIQLHTKIKRATEILHSGGFVHGDLRRANVMVRKNWKDDTAQQDLGVMLLDFDWAGEAGKVQYPANLNRQLYRPEGVEDGAVITVDHDVDMVDHILD